MEPDEIHGKFHEELKWGSYFFILSAAAGIPIAIIYAFFLQQDAIIDLTLFILHLVFMVYCSHNCVKEKSARNNLSLTSKIFSFSAVFGICILYGSLLQSHEKQVFIRKREIEMVENYEELDEQKSNMFNDLINHFKRTMRS